MGRSYIMITLLMLQIVAFAIAVLNIKPDRKLLHYFILFLLPCILITHIFAYNTDAEDIYISLRFVKNFVEGKGLVFNTFDKVEGYSDFLWVMLIAGFHKLLNSDIPFTARAMSVVMSVVTLLYTYYLMFRLSQNQLLSYLTTFLVSISGCFACYGLSGLENPLYALFILLIINYSYSRKWWLVGLLTGLMTMTRPEGFIIYLPVALYIFLQEDSAKNKIFNCVKVAFVAAIPVLPWVIWRVHYYGFIIPNTIAAKEGMDLAYQLRIGVIYTVYFVVIISESLLVLFILPLMNFIFRKQSFRNIVMDKVLLLMLATAGIFILFYTYAGGDWMPGYRFYASLVPLLCIIIGMLWNNYIFKIENISVLKSAWIVLIFAFAGYVQVRNSFMNPNLIPLVRLWYYQVEGFKVIGKWFHNTLPKNTLLATFPNGAFSYYNELPTLDYGGLTDNNVGRFGKKKKIGRPGHIAENVDYILSRKPDLIVIMDGQGFVNRVEQKQQFPGYQSATFIFTNYKNPNGEHVNINIRADEVQKILSFLLSDKNVKLIKLIPS